MPRYMSTYKYIANNIKTYCPYYIHHRRSADKLDLTLIFVSSLALYVRGNCIPPSKPRFAASLREVDYNMYVVCTVHTQVSQPNGYFQLFLMSSYVKKYCMNTYIFKNNVIDDFSIFLLIFVRNIGIPFMKDIIFSHSLTLY